MKPASQSEKNLALFAEYIKEKKIVIVDQNSSSRVGIARMLSNLGAKGPNIRTATDYEHGVKEIELSKPHIVVCDYDLGNRSGLELIQSLKKQSPDYTQSLFIMVTGNSSQSAVSQAAEEDVDTFILKPYTIEIFRQCLLKAAMSKLYPSDYIKKIDEGKKLLIDLKPAEAKAIFEEAKTMDPKPALACFYIGQAEAMEKALEQAQGSYSQGLNYNKIHYKCLTGLFDLLMEKKMVGDAYEVVKRISRYFPANPQRLAQVLRLAIMTKSYEDVERYYQSFIDLDARNDELVRYICAALVVCGKYYISTNNPSRGMELFRKASITGTGKVKILREIIMALAENEMLKDAREYLSRFPLEIQSGPDYQAMSYLVGSDSQPTTLTISLGRELVSKGVFDPVIHQVLIKKSIQEGYKDSAEELIREGLKKWPEQTLMFDKLSKLLAAAPVKSATK
jgi:DNA-binding NarL/FixJ family response regulator